MFRQAKPGKKSVELKPEARPSRIRRDPPALQPVQKAISAYPTEREIWAVVIGVVTFAVAIAIIILGVSDYTS